MISVLTCRNTVREGGFEHRRRPYRLVLLSTAKAALTSGFAALTLDFIMSCSVEC
jgi:hypothetical protein